MTARPVRFPQRYSIMHLLQPGTGLPFRAVFYLFQFFEIKSQITAFYSVIYMWEVKSVTGIQGPDSEKRERLTILIRQYEKDILYGVFGKFRLAQVQIADSLNILLVLTD